MDNNHIEKSQNPTHFISLRYKRKCTMKCTHYPSKWLLEMGKKIWNNASMVDGASLMERNLIKF